MNEFFTFTSNLSPYTKWVLIRLITGRVIGDKLSKADFLELGCTHNKFKKVIEELQEFNAILKHKTEHSKKGRPAESYIFIYDEHTEMTKSLPIEKLLKVEGKSFRVPVKIVWCFFVLNQDEFGHVENFSLPTIANACGLKTIEVKTAVTKLIEHDLITQLTRGCTFRKNEVFTYEENRLITKRPSAYSLSIPNYDSLDELNTTALDFNLLLSSKEVKIGDYVSSICNWLPSSFDIRYKVLFDVYLNGHFSGLTFELVKSYLADQPESSIDNFRSSLALLTIKCIKKILSCRNQKQHLSILDVSNSLFGTTDIFHMNSNLYHLSSFITSFINVYVNCLLFITYAYFKKSTPFRVKAYRNYISEIDNMKANVFVLKRNLFLCLNTNNLTPKVRIVFSSKI
ncbi:hypothetical protein H5158_05560 [Pseudoalteromonas sp. SR45-6]|uniref:hypothetical protein n=1 Tax=Pseudoalteromonas sp. SR45-6 TaxID=2760927 RepID=UPI001603B8CE|nr:hypothetical protein [Pseudoalteromonas sp. SR45-6]MBB1341104.1 hypothetical protein [Pseudoalteromonas sp. SR45-6]